MSVKTKHRAKKGIYGRAAQITLNATLALVGLLVCLPLYVTLVSSVKPPVDFFMNNSIWKIPFPMQFDNYVFAFNAISRNLVNSLVVCFSVTFGVLLFSSVTAYVFVRYDFMFKETLFALILALMMIPGILTLTPLYLVVLNLNLRDTAWAMILPGIAGGQVGAVFLFRTFFSQQPKDIYSSAVIDGASDPVMYALITLPLGVPVLIIQGIGTFGAMYGDFLWPQLVMQVDSGKTLMQVLRDMAIVMGQTKPGATYAMFILSGIPLILVSVIGLKYFISGDFAAGLKL